MKYFKLPLKAVKRLFTPLQEKLKRKTKGHNNNEKGPIWIPLDILFFL